MTGLSKGTTYYLRAYSRVGSKIEYYEDEVSVETVGGKEFSVKVVEIKCDGCLNLTMVCDINVGETYLIEIDGDPSVSLKKNADYVKSLYIESGVSTFFYKQHPKTINGAWYIMSEANLVFTNIENGVRYFYEIPYHVVKYLDYIK